MNPTEALQAGCDILAPALTSRGFMPRPIESGQGSSGTLARTEYVRADWRRGANYYPGFAGNPLDGFRRLRDRLERYCARFLSGTDKEMQQINAKVAEHTKVSGFETLSESARA